MANLVNGSAFHFGAEVTLAAIDNNLAVYERTKIFEFNPAVILPADAALALGALLTDLAAIEEADIIRYRLVQIFDTNTGPVASVGNLRKEAILTLRVDGSQKKVAHTIFSPYDAMVSGKDVVVTALLQAYLDNFETGGDFAISDGEFISTDEATRIVEKRIRHVPGARR